MPAKGKQDMSKNQRTSDSILSELKKFNKNYRRFHISLLKREHGKDSFIPSHSFKELLENMHEAVNEFSTVSSGCMRMSAKIVLTLEYGDGLLFNDSEPVNSIDIPIKVVHGSCGRKHLMIELDNNKALDLGIANFHNFCDEKRGQFDEK